MRRSTHILFTFIFFLICIAGCKKTGQDILTDVPEKTHSAVTPVRMDAEEVQEWYWDRHDAVNERLKQGNVGMLFIGNSITHGWEWDGIEYWNQYYTSRNAVNMGFGWDKTQHVLWRLDNSDFSNVSPELAVVLIGTNNSNGDDNTVEEIADGIIAVCQRLRASLPDMKILLLAIFPRDQLPSVQREKCTAASLLASEISDNKMIHYLDLSDRFLSDVGLLSQTIMPDYLHPNKEGYRIWVEAMEPKIVELMAE